MSEEDQLASRTESARLYGLGVGPGDPELVTIKAQRILATVGTVFLPRAATKDESLALSIAAPFMSPECRRREVVFPMTSDRSELERHWRAAVQTIAEALSKGGQGAFLTLGDPCLYSTFTYVQRGLKKYYPEIETVTIPGVSSPSACAAAWGQPLVEAAEKMALVPASRLEEMPKLLELFDTIVLMKVGKKLPQVVSLLESLGLMAGAVFVSRVGMNGERLEENLEKLKEVAESESYLSTIIIRNGRGGAAT